MPLLLRKKPEVATPAHPAWHPNFSNPDKLPDTKVVRTAFFVNGGAIIVVIVLLTWFGYNEYQLFDLRRQIDTWQAQIEHDRPASNTVVAQYQKFQSEAARITEIDTFLKSKPIFSELLLHLAETLPNNIALDEVEFRESTIILHGTVRGAPDFASGYASTYLQKLKADPALKGKFTNITLVSLNRDTQTGRLLLEITLKVEEPKKS